MENTIYIEDLKLNKDRKESIIEIQKYLLSQNLKLKFFIASGDSTIASCSSYEKMDYEKKNEITNYINNNSKWKR